MSNVFLNVGTKQDYVDDEEYYINDLHKNGYVLFSLSDKLDIQTSSSDINKFITEFEKLPIDPYDEKKTRFRRYGRAVFFPWDSTFHWIPSISNNQDEPISPYFQGNYNPEHIGEVRHFAAMSEGLLQSPVVAEIVKIVTSLTYFSAIDSSRPSLVGVHFISQQVDQENPVSVVSPNCMHQDGEMFDFVILVGRQNVTGGKNYIASADATNIEISQIEENKKLEEFILESSFEGFGVEDVRVSHGVSPVQLEGNAKNGFRQTILIDVTPLAEDLRAI